MRALALRRSVMSSSSTTAPPPAIGWNVHDSERPRAMSGSVVMMSRACESSISARMILPLGAEHAQPVRHVVQRGVELARDRCLALPRDEGTNEHLLQAGRDVLEREEEHDVQKRHAEIIRAAVNGHRHRHGTAG